MYGDVIAMIGKGTRLVWSKSHDPISKCKQTSSPQHSQPQATLIMPAKSSYVNVLPNSYIPVLSKKVLRNVLSRLPKRSLMELIYVWPKIINTQPQLQEPSGEHRQRSYNNQVSREALEIKKNPGRISKSAVIDKIIFQYWSKGLNLLQLSQVDCQLIIDRPNAYFWVSSTVLDSRDAEVPLLLDPKTFLGQLVEDLNMLYMTYIYVCKHPKLPLLIIRIQLFDLQAITTSTFENRPHISSNKPYFLAIPLNSSHIIHSPGNDMVTNIVLQVVERSLPQNPNNLLRLRRNTDHKPVRSLESMHILKGSSRFSNSLGVWTPYADGTVDLLPFSALETHPTLRENDEYVSDDENPTQAEFRKLRAIANLRFKGSRTGIVKSSKLYDDIESKKKYNSKKSIVYDDVESELESEEDVEANEFSTIAPVQYAEFILKDSISEGNPSSITLTLTGLDVFAGLHELSVSTIDQNKVLDPSTVPGFLTGEEGATCGTIENFKFSKITGG